MQFETKKKHTVIASEQFLIRLGIKSLINVIGVESELHEVDNIEDLEALVKTQKHLDYLIISEGILPQHGSAFFKELKKSCTCYKSMLIGEENVNACPCDYFVSNSYGRKKVVENLQNFFYEPEVKTAETESTLLSDRETDVLKAVAQGYSNKEIADLLYISINTVITHRKNITSKLGIKTISGLTVYALMHNLIQAEEVM